MLPFFNSFNGQTFYFYYSPTVPSTSFLPLPFAPEKIPQVPSNQLQNEENIKMTEVIVKSEALQVTSKSDKRKELSKPPKQEEKQEEKPKKKRLLRVKMECEVDGCYALFSSEMAFRNHQRNKHGIRIRRNRESS